MSAWVNHTSWKCTNHFPSIHLPHTAKKCYIWGCSSIRPGFETQPPAPVEPVEEMPPLEDEEVLPIQTFERAMRPRFFQKTEQGYTVSLGGCPVCGGQIAPKSKYCSPSCRKKSARKAYRERAQL